MKKKVSKIFKKYGDKKVLVVKEYKAFGSESKPTTAIKGARKDINHAIGNILLKGSKEERELVGETMLTDYHENWDSENRMVIKY